MAEPAAEDPAMAMEVLNPSQCWAFLRSAEVGRMAVVVDGEPEIFPLNYIVDHGSLVFRSAPGTKLAALDTASLVAFEVDGYEPEAGQAWSVVVKGRAESIARPYAALEAGELPLFPWQASPVTRRCRPLSVQAPSVRHAPGRHPLG